MKPQKKTEVTEDGLQLRFEGEGIDLNTLIENLESFKEIAEETFNKTLTGKRLAITVKGIPPRSVLVDTIIQVYETGRQAHVFGDSMISTAADLVTVIGGIYCTAVFLKGRKPVEVKTEEDKKRIQIRNNKGTVQYFDYTGATIYLQDGELQEKIARTFEKLDEDPNVEAFEVKDSKGKVKVRAEKKDFRDISRKDIEEDEFDNKMVYHTEKNIQLPVVSFDLEFRKNWGFYFNNILINAKIKSEKLRQLIEEGERFGKGDALVVDLEIKREHDEVIDYYINKAYTIVEFYEVIHRPPGKQGNLFRDNDNKKSP